MKVILDASAILAVIHGERGAEVVIEALSNASMSAVNYAEVVTKLVERKVTIEAAMDTIKKIGVRIVAFDVELARRCGALRASTKQFGLSLADRACLALAQHESALALTADRKWLMLDIGITVRLIR